MQTDQTNPDWSALVPVSLAPGPRRLGIYRALRELIETRQLPPGSKLPPTRELAARLGAARGAVVAAFEMLVADGFAEARVGSGTFVADMVPAMTRPEPARRQEQPAQALPGTLGVATPDPRTMRIFRRLLAGHLARPQPRLYHYGDPRGDRRLREAVADYLRTARGVRCTAERIVLTSGTQQGLDLFIRAALKPGDPVWVEDPCYPSARAALAGAGMRLTGVPVDAEGLDVAGGVDLCADARAAYVTPSHQFPLGVAMTMRRRLQLVAWARQHGSWIVEDDYDSEFRYAGAPLTSLQGVDDADRVVYLGTFSKILFPGLRLGYAVLPEALLDAVMDIRNRTDRFPPSLVEPAMSEFIAQGHLSAHLRRARRSAQKARDMLVEALRETGLDAHPPAQGLHLICPLPAGCRDTDVTEAAHAAGLGARALSPMYVDAPPRNGLVIGYSGFAPELLRAAALGLAGCL